jgi:hypothetical protein
MNNAHINPRLTAAKDALIAARDIANCQSKSYVEESISEMERASSMPVGALKNHIWRVYRKKEPQRVQLYLDIALDYARGKKHTDRGFMTEWLNSAQEHSAVPLEKAVIDKIYQEYSEHEPQRARELADTLSAYARERSMTEEILTGCMTSMQESSGICLEPADIKNIYKELRKKEFKEKIAKIYRKLFYLK